MTRQECEDKILDLLTEISNVYDEYCPGNNGLCTIVGGGGYVSVLHHVHGEDGEPIVGVYDLRAEQIDGVRHYGR